jgi:putative membrane protein
MVVPDGRVSAMAYANVTRSLSLLAHGFAVGMNASYAKGQLRRNGAKSMTTENTKLVSDAYHLPREIALWLAIACILAAAIGYSWDPTPFAQALAAIFIGSALLHGAFLYGARAVLVLFVMSVTITFAVENVGATTGFPFGRYHFEVGNSLPHIGSIPIIVGPLWFGAGYFSWVVASILLDGADRRLNRPLNVVALPIVSAFVMTQWDLVMDPPESTISKAWIWHDGGADFGVPLSNYLGWLLTSWSFYQAFALYLRRRAAGWLPDAQRHRKLALIAILFYVSAGLTHVVPWLTENSGEVADAAGHVWRIHDLRETTVAVMLFTMFFTAMLAVLRLVKEDLSA